MPHMKELHRRYKDQGLVLVGVHTKASGEQMADYVKKEKLKFPVAIDAQGKTVQAYHVDSFPDYYLIDRAGKLRVADLANGDLERVVKVLLKEMGRPRQERMILGFSANETEFEGKKLTGETLVKEIFEKWPAIQRKDPSPDALRILAMLAPALKKRYVVVPTPKMPRYLSSKPLMKPLDSPHFHIRKAAIDCLKAMYSQSGLYKPGADRARRRKIMHQWKKRIEKMKR